MKRRNTECGKLRRPMKRSKITEGIYGSTFLYLKFLLVWALVLMADFILEFRFEYLWPFWLLLRSVYDSFKYQGLAFSVFFVCIAVTSDVVCYLFIPVQWLFFAASTYVWVQYVWHTERGICLPTVSLWLLFVYIEGSVRLRELKTMPFHMDLCRPFAAHCIGYPVVTLGFGFKSYVSYRLRLRKQKEVQKENEFYNQLLREALPPELQNPEKHKALPSKSQEEVISNGVTPSSTATTVTSTTALHTPLLPPSTTTRKSSSSKVESNNCSNTERGAEPNKQKHNNVTAHTVNTDIDDYQYIEQAPSTVAPPMQCKNRHNNLNDCADENLVNEHSASKTYKASNGITTTTKTAKLNKDNVVTAAASSGRKGKSTNTSAATAAANSFMNNKDEVIVRLEADVKRLKADLQGSRNCEQELQSQINNTLLTDKALKTELYQLRQDNESLQNKLHNLVTSRQQDKQNLAALERKLLEERKQKASVDQQLMCERKAKKAEEAVAARAVALATAARNECTEVCKTRQQELEGELKQIRRELKVREDQIRQLDRETQTLRQYKETQNDTEVLMSALAAMQDKTTHLENSLSAETRLKLDLFSALGEAKRQMEIHQGLVLQKNAEISDLKAQIAEVLALMPTTTNFTTISTDSSPHFSSKFTTPNTEPDVLSVSRLNPNASDYMPKISQ
ncbi:Macoilin [Lamellibrachia satsuma]|nr:Macoilin [Lamellibrachia satsuma]